MPSDTTIAAHAAFAPGRVAVITGAASGIGRAAAKRYAAAGMKVCLADLSGEALTAAAVEVTAAAVDGAATVMTVPTDVSSADDVTRLRDAVLHRFGEVAVLMNNAGISLPTTAWGQPDNWRKLLEVNLWGVINGVQAFVPGMIAQQTPALVINTGSKQGITNPPGNIAYNVAKAGVKALTEQLAHELRRIEGCKVGAHLLVPGFTFTGLTRAAQKPAAAWTPEQVVDFMLASIASGDFYILCPDNDVSRAIDERRMQWNTDDMIHNRPALSRWHAQFKSAFEAFMKG